VTANPRVFGSVPRGLDQEGSDLDGLVDGLSDTRTQRAVAMNLVIIAELAARLIEDHEHGCGPGDGANGVADPA
jgi:predicted nucleotidyltransferase